MATALAFTGGKDCVLALHLASGWRHELLPPPPTACPPVRLAVVFGPAEPDFKAHPLPVVEAIAGALQLPLLRCVVDGGGDGGFVGGYARALRRLAAQHGVTHLLTGDVEDVAAGFMDAAVAEAGGGLALVRPLWRVPRRALLDVGWQLGVRAVVSCVDRRAFAGAPLFDPAALLGRQLTPQLVAGPLAQAAELCNVDLAGERGEYHTLVTACPLMRGEGLPLRALRVADTADGRYAYVAWELELLSPELQQQPGALVASVSASPPAGATSSGSCSWRPAGASE